LKQPNELPDIIPPKLFDLITQSLAPLGFKHESELLRGILYAGVSKTTNEHIALIIDHGACDRARPYS